MSRYPILGATLLAVALSVILTWPQALHLGSKVAAHNDPHFSMWRLAWIAHALRTQPHHLFDANIFYPQRRTLAYSDATILEGAIAAPLLWAHVSPVLVYNLLLLGGMAASGVGMFVLVRRLTANTRAALVASTIFTMAPYRLEHFMHLELQWAMWMPLVFWAIHRAVDDASWRFGALAGIFLWLQVMSSVYYGIFLAMAAVVLVVALAIAEPRRVRAALPALSLGAVLAALLMVPYALPYLQNVNSVGVRQLAEVAQYSARPMNYLASPPQNWLWGWTADRFGGNETRLFPGLFAVALALAALLHRPRRLVWVYGAVCAAAFGLSLGVNGPVYGWLFAHVEVMHGLRAPARCAIVASCALAVLAGLGISGVERRLRPSRAANASLAALVLLIIEFSPAEMYLTVVAHKPPDVYKMMQSMGPGVVAELPMPTPARMPKWDAVFAYWSTNHWNPLVNGYSGFYPPEYIETIERMRTFPDDASLARLKDLDVRYIVVHRALYEHAEYASLLVQMAQRPDLKPNGRYGDPIDEAELFEIVR